MVRRHSRPASTALLLVALIAGCAAPATSPAPATLPATPGATAEPVLRGESFAPGGPSTPVATTPPVATAEPSAETSARPPIPAEPYALNLYERGDYVAQYTFEWCVGASIQMTLAMTDETDDLSRAAQQRFWEMARDRSSSPFGGANPRGWVAALNDLGVGPYELVSVPDLPGALRVAASAMRATKRPVGLVMWRGRHAWMMSGFESTADPSTHDAFEVTGVRVLDPLYPHGSARWGASPKPNALLSPDKLGEQFVARLGGRVDLGVAPGYLLVLPRNG